MPNSCITSPPSVAVRCPQVICFSLYFRKKSDKLQYWFRKGFVTFSVSPVKLSIGRVRQICFMGRYVLWSMLVISLVDENKPGHICMYGTYLSRVQDNIFNFHLNGIYELQATDKCVTPNSHSNKRVTTRSPQWYIPFDSHDFRARFFSLHNTEVIPSTSVTSMLGP